MAVDNIDLSGEIKAWKDAAYGKDVRAANVAAFEKIQGTVNDTVQNVNQASEDASSASQNAQKAVDDIQSAIETATSKASEAAGSATAADTSKKAAASSAAAADNSKTQAAASAAEAKKIAQGLGDFDGTAAKVKITDTYGLVVSALGESTAQALIDAIANKVVNELINKNKIVNNLLATDASTVLAGTQGAALDKRLVAAEKAVTQLNSEIGYIQNYDIDTLSSPSQLTHSGYYQFVNCSSTVNDNASTKFTDYQIGDFVGLLITRNGYATSDAGCQWGTFIITSPRFTNKFWIGRIWGYKFVNFIKIGS
ncbi:hypothetical protein DWZ76_07115 [Clostridium sp. AF35-15]|uniref:hypothetical protein n=1 Tax=Clostridium sp. AF35-15 TaxID=2293013 RepID=UPI000E539A79|nr:hypothetical protein [Clostridium sp. AF35-15]RHP14943.1 hypothetical protein DWZ76_07115 [Clostridium sp. AF35-15]